MSATDTGAIRKIIHIDMDAFFASVEQRDNPQLRGKPVAVGGQSARGVVAAASYEARAFGVRSAMPSSTARRKCPDLIFVPHRFEVYREVSHQIRAIFSDYTDLVEPLSLDEAYLDMSHRLGERLSATDVAREIRRRIRAETGLTASAGVSYNKFIAKLASDQNKPDGLCVIKPAQGADFVARLPVSRFHGVGPVTAARMLMLGIKTGADLRAVSQDWLREHFGRSADYFFAAARGEDDRPVQPDRVRKSVGVERTYSQNLTGGQAVRSALILIISMIWDRVQMTEASGHTLTLKVRFADFRQITRSRTQSQPITDQDGITSLAELLLNTVPLQEGPVRLLGLTLSGLATRKEAMDEEQLSLPF